MKINHTHYKRTLLACLVSTLLAACGESDLVALQDQELDDARAAAQVAPPIGSAAPTMDVGTDSTESGGDTANESAGESTTGGTAGSNTAGGDTQSSTDGDSTGSATGGSSDADSSTDTSGNTDTDGTTETSGTSDVENTGSSESANSIDLTDYELVFSDEFRGTAIDSTKWNTALAWGPDVVIFDQLQYYVDIENQPDFGFDPFTLDGERLTISAIETPEALRAAANEQSWLSGVLTTAGKFAFTYGYAEVSVDLQQGAGIWPSFWMLSSEFEGLKPELFVMEYDGSKPDSIFHNYNFQDADGNLRSPGQWEITQSGISEGFHTVGVRWSPEELLFFIDGEPRYRVAGEDVPSQDIYMILNLAMGGVWPAAPDDTTPSPATVVVDYVRVYQLK